MESTKYKEVDATKNSPMLFTREYYFTFPWQKVGNILDAKSGEETAFSSSTGHGDGHQRVGMSYPEYFSDDTSRHPKDGGPFSQGVPGDPHRLSYTRFSKTSYIPATKGPSTGPRANMSPFELLLWMIALEGQ